MHAASGGVGMCAVQLALQRGARVIGLAGPDSQDFVKSLGATPALYGEGWAERVRELAPDGVDAELDASGRGELADSVTLAGGPERVLTIAARDASEHGVRSHAGGGAQNTARALEEVLALIESGNFQFPVARTFALEDRGQRSAERSPAIPAASSSSSPSRAGTRRRGRSRARSPPRSCAVTMRSVVETMSVCTLESLKPSRSHSSAATAAGSPVVAVLVGAARARCGCCRTGRRRSRRRASAAMKLRDPREAAVGERELAHPVGALGGDHLGEHALVLLGAGLDDAPVGELEADALDEVAVAVERLVEADPALGAAPVGAREDLEARDVAPAPAQPAALLAER